jgi:hypothetical protein
LSSFITVIYDLWEVFALMTLILQLDWETKLAATQKQLITFRCTKPGMVDL